MPTRRKRISESLNVVNWIPRRRLFHLVLLVVFWGFLLGRMLREWPVDWRFRRQLPDASGQFAKLSTKQLLQLIKDGEYTALCIVH
ncbi:hypothetical protein BaRGS_00011438 [Batillaria attramentaria]|uniref:Uncharacterized protein n=1 Tax=Batillaria attramentaria TaxID=370345 RepID=A0ABD0LEE8_9CAEN